MSETVEIYICKPGQALKEGRVEYSHSIAHRNDAMADARDRCQRDKTIAKIAYYKVDAEGAFRLIYTHVAEPKATPTKKSPPASEPTPRRIRPAAKPKKKGLIEKVLSAFR